MGTSSRFVVAILFVFLLLELSRGEIIYPKNCPDDKGFQSFDCGLDGWTGEYFKLVEGRVCAGWFNNNCEICSGATEDTFWPIGGYHIRLRYEGTRENGMAYIERSISTKGFKNIKLKYARAVRDVEGSKNECLLVQYYNGTTWNTVPGGKYCGIYYYFDGWTITKDLKSRKDANDNPKFRIRFILTNVECDESAFVDRVKLEGNRCNSTGEVCTKNESCCSDLCNKRCCKVGVDCSGTGCDDENKLRNKVCDTKGDCVLDMSSEAGTDTDGDGADFGCDYNDSDPCSITGNEDNCDNCNHCNDGTQNCDETGTDCGGSCEPCGGYSDGHSCQSENDCENHCDLENKTCFSCTPCSGVDRCSNQEPNECELQCGANKTCDDKQVDSHWISDQACRSCKDCLYSSDDTVGSCECSGDCIKGYCENDNNCYYGVSCTLNGWDYSDKCSTADSCDANTLVTGKTCGAGGCSSGATYTCDDTTHTNCQKVNCNGSDYYCTYDGSSWEWRTSKPEESIAAGNCEDDVDNDCDSDADEEDMDCGGTGCNPGEKKPCDKQDGVCAGSFMVCLDDKNWGECSYTNLSNYEDGKETQCGDGADNDCDNKTDCDDEDCLDTSTCKSQICSPIGSVEPCGPGVCSNYNKTCLKAWENEEHGKWFCNYSEIQNYEKPETSCNDGLDNDCDGAADCGDPTTGEPEDTDCVDPSIQTRGCYNGNVYLYDSCGWPASNPTTICADDDLCTIDECMNGECVYSEPDCITGDGCCPTGCTPENDNDCKTCLSDSDCDDNINCTVDTCSGTPEACHHVRVTSCASGDGCCPAGCNYTTDSDCPLEPTNTPPTVELLEPARDGYYSVWGISTGVPVEFRAIDPDTENLDCYYEIDGILKKLPKAKSGEIVTINLPMNWSNDSQKVEKTIMINCTDGISYATNSSNFHIVGKPPTADQDETEGKPKSEVERFIRTFTPIPDSYYDYIPIPVRENLDLIFAALIGFALLVFIVTSYLSRAQSREVIEKKLREEREKEKKITFRRLKDRRAEIRSKLAKIKKAEVGGLSKALLKKKKAYENELILLQEDLLKNDLYLKELSDKADEALEQAKKGIPSKEIMKQLVEEGYTKKEIEIIKRAFQRRLIKGGFLKD
ncbi:MAG: hypothetical protein J7L23_01635 [Candidatus Diapherotrites archaeon]|nr:hypothetical protein [Candidatus Diapherotrites archaeon]